MWRFVHKNETIDFVLNKLLPKWFNPVSGYNFWHWIEWNDSVTIQGKLQFASGSVHFIYSQIGHSIRTRSSNVHGYALNEEGQFSHESEINVKFILETAQNLTPCRRHFVFMFFVRSSIGMLRSGDEMTSGANRASGRAKHSRWPHQNGKFCNFFHIFLLVSPCFMGYSLYLYVVATINASHVVIQVGV